MKVMNKNNSVKKFKIQNKFLKAQINLIKTKYCKKIWLPKKLRFQLGTSQATKIKIRQIHKK
jgi:hypothetical protein